jgi:phytol kinase
MFSNLWLPFIITLLIALLWLRFNDYLAHKGYVDSQLSRKFIHIGTGPIFVLCWMLFPENPWSRYIAAIIPLGITAQFALVGLGIWKDQSAVDAMSRSGDRREILRGPLFYGIVFVILTIFYWRDSTIGIVALMLLCGGDGLADVVGQRFVRIQIPWSKKKTLEGSLAMFAGSWVTTFIVLLIYFQFGSLKGSFASELLPVTVICVIGTLVESLPFGDIDNLSVPAVAVLLGHLFQHWS